MDGHSLTETLCKVNFYSQIHFDKNGKYKLILGAHRWWNCESKCFQITQLIYECCNLILTVCSAAISKTDTHVESSQTQHQPCSPPVNKLPAA